MSRLIARDPISIPRTPGQYAIQTLGLNTESGYNLSMVQREQIAYNNLNRSQHTNLKKVGISNRGLLQQTRSNQSVFERPMIQNNAELVQRYTRPVSGTSSNPQLSQQRVAIGQDIMSKSQAVFSGRLY